MKQYRLTLDGQVFDVKVLDDPRRALVQVEVNGERFTVGLETVPTAAVGAVGEVPLAAAPLPTAPLPPAAAAASGSTVSAPLVGVIKAVVVQPGQQIASNDELLIMEAMKMEIIIRASRPGTVGSIYVSEGDQVAYGEPLLAYAD